MLETYLVDTADLLHDSANLLFSRDQLTRYVNSARRQTAYRSGCIRRLVSGQAAFGSGAQPGSFIPGAAQPGALPGAADDAEDSTPTNTFQTIAGVELYPYGYANPYLRAQYEGVEGIVDIVSLAVSWGSVRPVINWLPWDDLQAYARSYNIGVTSYPFYWASNGDGETAQVWLFPVPTAAMEMEWDCLCVPKPLYSNETYDAIPETFRTSVKYYAAHLAYLNSQRYNLAQLMLKEFVEHIQVSRAASMRSRQSSYYW